MPKGIKTPQRLANKIIRYFLNHKDNSSRTIADHYAINIKTVDLVLTEHFKKKQPKIKKPKTQ